MLDVIWLSVDPEIPARSYWDQTLLSELLKDCNHWEVSEIPNYVTEAIVIIPGAYQGKHIQKINQELWKLQKCKAIITSDEENNFPIDELLHPNMEVYATYYNPKYKREIKWLPLGPAKIDSPEYVDKDLSWFFAGQVNHKSRSELVGELENITGGLLIKTDGFAQGLPQDEYLSLMNRAKSVPAPRGNISPDSFRFYEALEHGAIPIPEDRDYWTHLFDMPFPSVGNWEEIALEIHQAHDIKERNKVFAWWQREKFNIKTDLIGRDDITVVIPVSPIKSHPSTEIIDETIKSIRYQLPNAPIIVTFDGVRDESKHRDPDYQEFIARFLLKYNNQNIYPVIFDEHTHQVGMMREVLKDCSEYIVYVEQDTPFTEDYIDWQGCKNSLGKRVNLIRFHFEAFIPEPHEYLMMGEMKATPVPLIRTKQYSQRPHITTRLFYEKILSNFSENAKSFIEDKMHSVAQEFPNQYRLAIYNPDGSMKRSFHTDGRAGEDKLDGTQVF